MVFNQFLKCTFPKATWGLLGDDAFGAGLIPSRNLAHFFIYSLKIYQGIFQYTKSRENIKNPQICDSFFFSSTTLLLPTHFPPLSCTHAQSCNPMDCSPPGSSVHGLFQARILEWVAISFSTWFLKCGSRFTGSITHLEWKFQNSFFKMQVHYSVRKAKNTFGMLWKDHWDKLSKEKNTVLQTIFYLKIYHLLVFYLCIFFGCTACGILVPNHRWNFYPLQWKHTVLTTGCPGKFLIFGVAGIYT